MKIGITGTESKTQYYLNQTYIDYVHETGMQAVMIVKTHDIDIMVNMLDGLILPGGIDIDPIHYGDDNYTSYRSDPEKDAFERAVFHAFRKAGKPIFGICRGFQLIIREYLNIKPELSEILNFWTDIPNHNQVSEQDLSRTTRAHFVNYLPGLLYGKTTKLLNKSTTLMPVNSMHHQALIMDFNKNRIDKTGGFKAVAWTTRGLEVKKGVFLAVCEAFQIVNWGSRILAVQWHPEELKDINLLHNFFLNPVKADNQHNTIIKTAML